jgi:cytochrome c-type biogenesis protein CcmE
MKANQIKIGVAVVVCVMAIVYLVFSGFEDTMVYYLTVKELKAKGSEVYNEGIRVSGRVEQGSIESNPITLEHRFVIEADGETLDVLFRGIAPDTFKDGAEVVVEGKYDPAGGVFLAEMLLAKCPSKYEEMEADKL